jgi:hypothetical protein
VYVFDVTDFTSPATPAALYVNSEPVAVLLYAEEVAPFEAPEPFVPTTPVFVPTNENVEPSADRFIDGDVRVVFPATSAYDWPAACAPPVPAPVETFDAVEFPVAEVPPNEVTVPVSRLPETFVVGAQSASDTYALLGVDVAPPVPPTYAVAVCVFAAFDKDEPAPSTYEPDEVEL